MSVNVALPSYLCERRGEMIESGIRKKPVADRTGRRLRRPTSQGDGQGDLRVHGGPEKAVYAYPSEHWAPWTAELEPEQALGPGSFGENLSTAGMLEDDACIGDIWRWGEVRLQICQPRYPCYKLGEALARSLESSRPDGRERAHRLVFPRAHPRQCPNLRPDRARMAPSGRRDRRHDPSGAPPQRRRSTSSPASPPWTPRHSLKQALLEELTG